MKHLISCVVLAFLTSGCVQQETLIKPTTSGYPERLFRNANVEEVKAKIMDDCASRGLIISETTSNHVVCEKTMEGGDAVLAQLLVGNSYSTTPLRKVRFVAYRSGNDVKVTAQEWIQSRMAMGQVRTQELKSSNQVNSTQSFLFSMGAE